jgi:hypothetical protein
MTNDLLLLVILDMIARIKQLEEALKWYADSEHWEPKWFESGDCDYGEVARAALER